jgi:dTDP-4-amino-4,6-dideoxygalactose transaminase
VTTPLVEVPRYDYPSQWRTIHDDVAAELISVLRDGPHVLGPRLASFEEDFAAYTGTGHCVGVNSGTDAIVMALRVLDVGPGDEVVTQANTFHATVSAITAVGARPVLVDVDEEFWTISVAQVAAALTPSTKAIVPVHMYGAATPMADLLALARARDIPVVEDCAQAHGAGVEGRPVGSFGAVGCFSFHPSKNLAAAGDSGAIVSADASLASRARRLRNLGQATQNDHVEVGWNSRIDELQAVVLAAKLKFLDAWNRSRADIARRYAEGLSGLPVRLQRVHEGATSVHHLFQVMTARRDELVDHLRSHGVDAVVRYPVPVHRQPAFAAHFADLRPHRFPVATSIAESCCCLPLYAGMDPARVDHVLDRVRQFFERG